MPIGLGDTATTALRFECEYTDLIKQWDTITSLIGRQSVHDPDWIKQFRAALAQAPLPADKRFVEQFNRWRLVLGESLVARNKAMTETEVNDAVQRIFNRLVFVRMCEDRGIEGEGVLRDAFTGATTDVVDLFKRLNGRYNTGIFQAADAPNDPVLLVRATALKSTVNNLYAPLSPFSFAMLDADFLGLVYEASLAEHLTIASAGGRRTVSLNKKREYAKRDVVTTPQELVTSTVRAAVDETNVDVPKTLDFAVGSGRFLVAVLDTLIERGVVRRTALPGQPGLLKVAEDTYRLSFGEKRRLLVDHCFGSTSTSTPSRSPGSVALFASWRTRVATPFPHANAESCRTWAPTSPTATHSFEPCPPRPRGRRGDHPADRTRAGGPPGPVRPHRR